MDCGDGVHNDQCPLVRPMEDIVVRKTGAGGVPIHVKDLGYVVDSHETQTAIVRIDGTRGVFMRVNKQPGANTVAVVDQVRALIPQVIGVPPGVNVGITFDQSTYIRQAIESLWHEALQGSALAFLVILIFLRSLTSTLIISIAIPLSILLSFIVMYFLGQTLNVFTLGGLALAVGRLVDDSIVELENINRHLNISDTPRRQAVLDAAREVAMPIFSATMTTIIVFVPTVFLEGQIKLLFIPLTFTISISLFASFLVSRTVTPLLALKLITPERPIDPASRSARGARRRPAPPAGAPLARATRRGGPAAGAGAPAAAVAAGAPAAGGRGPGPRAGGPAPWAGGAGRGGGWGRAVRGGAGRGGEP